MRTIPLGGRKARGRIALVDDADYELVSRYRWYLGECNGGPGHRPSVYARTNVPAPGGRQKTIRMHILIMGYRFIDHADGDGLNNQRYNLRPVNHALNNANRRAAVTHNGKPKRSRYKGVTWFDPGPGKGRPKWAAKIRVNGKVRNLGYFRDEESAARVYDAAALEAWGEYACPNFPKPPSA